MKSFAIFIILLSILILGCLEQEPTGTPVPTMSPTPTGTVAPTIIPTTITIPTPVPTLARLPETYKSLVDADFGFYKIVNMNLTLPVLFDANNRTLSIEKGDTIIFVNYPTGNVRDVLTIVSNEGLWDNRTGNLQLAFKQFNYTFNETGSFTVYVKEFKKVVPLKIIVT